MKKFLAVCLLMFALPLAAQVSYDTVTATVTDPGGNPYANAQFIITLVNAQGYAVSSATTPNGQLFNAKPVQGTLTSAGAMSVQLVPNNILMSPSGTQWKIVLSSPTNSAILTTQPPWSISASYTITAPVDLSAPLSALARPVNFVNLATGQSTLQVGTSLYANTAGTATHSLNLPEDLASQSSTDPQAGNFSTVTQAADPTAALQDATKQYSDILGSRQAAQPLMSCQVFATRDCRVGNFSDSTGNDGTYSYSLGIYQGNARYMWRWAQMMATRFPNYKVMYRGWDIGALVAVGVTSGGTGYAVNDTGTVSGGTIGYLATYTVNTVNAGVVTALTINFKGTGYSTYNSALATTATSGVGTGLTVSTLQQGYWAPYVTLNTPTPNPYMGDITLVSAGNSQSNGTVTIYDTGSGSANCVANRGTSHCASLLVTVTGGAVTSAIPNSLGNLNAGDAYTSVPVFDLTSLGGTPGVITATLNFTLFVDNMAVSGAGPRIIQGANYVSTISSQIPADLVIFNHGFNLGANSSQSSSLNPFGNDKTALTTMTETVTQGEPQAGVMMLNQSVLWGDNTHYMAQALRSNYIGQITGNRGYGLVNSYRLMTSNPNWRSDYFYFTIASSVAGSGYAPGNYNVTGTCAGGANPKLNYTILQSGQMDTSNGLLTSPLIISAGTCPPTSVPSFTLPPGGASVTPAAWSSGNVHGNDLWFYTLANQLMRSFVYTPDTAMWSRPPSSFETSGGRQLLTNSDFQTWSAGLPVGWTTNGGTVPTVTQDTTLYERGTSSVSVSQAGVSNSYITQTVCNTAATCAGLIGKVLTLTVRSYVTPSANSAAAGSIELQGNVAGNSIRNFQNNPGEGMGGWTWNSVSLPIATGTTLLRVFLWTSTGTEVQTVHWQAASLTIGALPHDTLGSTVAVPVTTYSALNVSGAAGTQRNYYAQTNSLNRVAFGAMADAETGSSAGSSGCLWTYDDTGTQIGCALQFGRAAGSAVVLGANRPFYSGDLFNTGRTYSTLGLANYSSYQNAFYETPTTGPQISTSVDANPGLIVWNKSNTATADLLQLKATGTANIRYHVDINGNAFAATFNPASARQGNFTCTAGGTITIANTNLSATSDVIITLKTLGGTISTPPAMNSTNPGTGFGVLCGAADTSVYKYSIPN